MLHVDIPTRQELERLVTHRAPACVSIYLPTTPLSCEAETQLQAVAADRDARLRVRDIVAGVAEIVDDDAFWRLQARSLVVFATAARAATSGAVAAIAVHIDAEVSGTVDDEDRRVALAGRVVALRRDEIAAGEVAAILRYAL